MTSFTYDDNGNRTQKIKGTDTWVYTYNYANRLKKVEENSTTLEEYVYDGDGKRIQVADDSKTTTYIYFGLNILFEETMNSAATYIYGPVGRIAKRTTIDQETNTYYYHTDYVGSTRSVTDNNKSIVTTAMYYPFGETYSQEGSEHYHFTGKEKDVTGLYYYGARYYDPELGRFITRDKELGSIRFPKTLNRYTYCFNNPVKYIDPDGCDPCGSHERWLEKNKSPHENDETDAFHQIFGLCALFLLWILEANCKAGSCLSDMLRGMDVDDWGAAAVAASGYITKISAASAFGPLYLIFQTYILPNLDELWENPEFRHLLSTAEEYARLYSMGGPFGEELTDSVILLAAYILEEFFGSGWVNLFPTIYSYYYHVITKQDFKKTSQQGGSVGAYDPPPEIEPA